MTHMKFGRRSNLYMDHSTIELLTIKDVAELLKVSKSSVRRLQQGRHLPFVKVGGSIRFAKSDLVEYLKKERVESIV